MTRHEAKMVAEELFKLFTKNGFDPKSLTPDRYVGTREAAEIMGWSVNRLYKKVNELPHVKKGRSLVFKESSIREYMENN